MMIDAEMYGMMPSANTEKRDSAPPENMLNRLRMPFCWPLNSCSSWVGSMPGTGMYEPTRYTSSASSRKISRRRRSPNFPVFASLVPPVATGCLSQPWSSGHAAAGRFDRGLRARGRGNAVQLDRAADRAGLDHLDRLGHLADQPCLLERQQVDLGRTQALERGQRQLRAELKLARLEATLRQPTLQRHLTAFETDRSEEHTSELQSPLNLVCRLLLEK